MKYTLDQFLELLDSNKTYEVPADIYSHAREYLNARDTEVRLKSIHQYWKRENKETKFEFGNEIKGAQIWNKEKLIHEPADVISVMISNESIDSFNPYET